MSEVAINPTELPSSWALTTLGAVVSYGRTTKVEPNEIADGDWVLELEDVEKDSSRLLQKMTFLQRQSKSTKNRFEAGDVLYGKLRPYLNKVLIAVEPGYCTTEILPLKAGTNLNNRYLFYWLKHPAFLKYVEAESHGMNMPRLGTDAGKSAPFVLAPRNEQTRIANQLDTLLTRIQSSNDRFDSIPALLKRFRQAVLDAALNGAFSGTEVDAVAPKVSISSIASVGTGSTPLRSNDQFFANSGTPWITSSATSEPIIERANEFVTPAAISAHRLKVYPKGTLLVAMYGEGKTRGQVAELGIEATINQACAAVVVDNTKALTAFVKFALQANYLNMRELAEGGNQPNLNLSKVKDFEIFLPGVEAQAEIVNRIERLFAFADRIEARAYSARVLAQRLSPLVLAKAFRGELVPQDPAEEPAIKLLERMKSATAVVRKKTLKVSNPKAVNMKYTATSTREEILKLPHGAYSFDRLRSLVPADYETLKDAIFLLLNEPSSGLKQIFDKAQNSVAFERSKT